MRAAGGAEAWAAVLRRYLPSAPPVELGIRFGFDRTPLLRAYAREAALRGQKLSLIDVAPPNIRKEMEAQSQYGRSEEAEVFMREVGAVLPWFVLSAEIACGRLPPDLAVAIEAAVKETSYAENRSYREDHSMRPTAALEWLRILRGAGASKGPQLEAFRAWLEPQREFLSTNTFTLENAGLPLRPIHGDPKVYNVMIHNGTGKAISIVDLDTVKPGLVHYDIGDCLRSGCNPLGEDAEDWEAVQFDPASGAAILDGYLSEARAFLTGSDYEYLFVSIRLIAFELGLRFFADHLAGDMYFKVKYPGHNLHRALVQFKLTESIEAHEAEIRDIIRKIIQGN